MVAINRSVMDLLDRHHPGDETERADVERVRALIESADDPWLRSIPLHLTGSALVVHPPTRRVLLRWHARQQAWLQVGDDFVLQDFNDAAETATEGRIREGVGSAASVWYADQPDIPIDIAPAQSNQLALAQSC